VASKLTVGVVSDTHGLVRPETLRALSGADVILHAGDVGGAQVLEALSRLAPVIAVRGNVDTDSFGRLLPERRRLDPGGVPLLLLHDRAALGADPGSEGIRVVVFGHSHRPWRSGGGACCGSTPAAAVPGASRCRCRWAAS